LAQKLAPNLRGYTAEHRRLRRALESTVAAGEALCWRCRRLIVPGEPWDLGHLDDRTGWAGPEHQRCNRVAGAKKGAQRRIRRRRPDPPPPSGW
jgi:hypothetical protein